MPLPASRGPVLSLPHQPWGAVPSQDPVSSLQEVPGSSGGGGSGEESSRRRRVEKGTLTAPGPTLPGPPCTPAPTLMPTSPRGYHGRVSQACGPTPMEGGLRTTQPRGDVGPGEEQAAAGPQARRGGAPALLQPRPASSRRRLSTCRGRPWGGGGGAAARGGPGRVHPSPEPRAPHSHPDLVTADSPGDLTPVAQALAMGPPISNPAPPGPCPSAPRPRFAPCSASAPGLTPPSLFLPRPKHNPGPSGSPGTTDGCRGLQPTPDTR